jgi:hypothetical protein
MSAARACIKVDPKGKSKPKLSVQELVECVYNDHSGCEGAINPPCCATFLTLPIPPTVAQQCGIFVY